MALYIPISNLLNRTTNKPLESGTLFATYAELLSYWLQYGTFYKNLIVGLGDENYSFYYLPAVGTALDADFTKHLKILGSGQTNVEEHRVIPESSYLLLVDTNLIDENVFYFTYEDDDEWVFGKTFPIILL